MLKRKSAMLNKVINALKQTPLFALPLLGSLLAAIFIPEGKWFYAILLLLLCLPVWFVSKKKLILALIAGLVLVVLAMALSPAVHQKIGVIFRFKIVLIAGFAIALFFSKNLAEKIEAGVFKPKEQSIVLTVFVLLFFVGLAEMHEKQGKKIFDYYTEKYSVWKKIAPFEHFHNSPAQKVFQYYPDSTLKMQGVYKNGIPFGEFLFFYPNGELQSRGKKLRRKTGFWEYWYETGQLKAQGFWDNNQKDSLWLHFYPNGQKSQEQLWKKGKPTGFPKCWNPKGERIFQQEFKQINAPQ